MEAGVNKYLHTVLCCIQDMDLDNEERRPLVGDGDGVNKWYTTKCVLIGTASISVTVIGIVALIAVVMGTIAVGTPSQEPVHIYTQYVRWGNRDCPSNATRLYYGHTAGQSTTGGGVTYLCLPGSHDLVNYEDDYYGNTPVIFTVATVYHTYVQGKDHVDAACAVCVVSSRSQVITIPASDNCVGEWTKEYDGYLMTDKSSSTIECVDTKMDSYGKPGNPGPELAQFFHVVADEEAKLPNFYHNDKVLRCAVCTK